MCLKWVFLMSVCLSLMVCTPAKDDIVNSQGILIKISNSAGDDFSYEVNGQWRFYAGYPFNHSELSNSMHSCDLMVVSKKLERGKYVRVRPIARMNLKNADNSRNTVIIAIPDKQDLQINDVNDYTSFMVNQFAIKQIIENWYSNRYGLQGSLVEGWQPIDMNALSKLIL